MTIINQITAIAIICVAISISSNSKTNERKQRDLHVLPVRVQAINRNGMPIYALQATEFLSLFHPKMKTRNAEHVQRRTDIIDEFLDSDKTDFLVKQPVTEQSTTAIEKIATDTTDLNDTTTEQLNKISQDLRQLDRTIGSLQKDYDQIKTNIRTLLDFKQKLLTPELLETLKTDLENLSTTFKDQSIKTNDTLTTLQFQIDEINESLLELVESRALHSYQTITIDKASYERKNSENFDKSESIFDFYLLINDFSKNFENINDFMNRSETNEITNFDSEYLESMFENITINLTKMKQDFVTLPLDFNSNATKELYQLISKIENHFTGNDNEDLITRDSFDHLKSRFQGLNLDVKNIKKLYVRIYNINLNWKMIHQDIVTSVREMMVTLNSILLSVEDLDHFSSSKI